ncbi:MAG: HAD family phosphatase, partial [Desulfobacteraceae bacterium]
MLRQPGGSMNPLPLDEPKAVLFDFEGTLVDFQWNLAEAVRETLAMLAASGFALEKFSGLKYSALMLQAQQAATEAGRSPEEVRNKIGLIYDRFDEDALSRWSLRPKADAFLSALRAAGIKTGLVSNIGRRILGKAFAKLKLDGLFDVAVNRNDVQNLKPHPEGILWALDRLGVPKEKALFIGDSLDDIQAARAAGIKVMTIIGGENKQAELLAARTDKLFHS